MDFNINSLKRKISKLRVDRNSSRYTVGKAPHKPVLLLSLILLDRNDRVDLLNIKPDLTLRETWGQLWECLDYSRPGPIHLPMYHMKSEGFWTLDPKDGLSLHQPKSLGELMGMTDRISILPDVVPLFQEEKTRNEIINSILHGGYFSEGEINNLRIFIKDYDGSFEYEEQLNHLLNNEFKMDLKAEDIMQTKRDPAFRRGILGAYDERCAVCELKLTTTSGISVIDAAHILPFSRFHNDDLRNGLSLCKMHHWLFDKGIMTIDNRYQVKVSTSIEAEHPEGAISDVSRKEILLPKDANKYPSHIALEWHRNEIFQ